MKKKLKASGNGWEFYFSKPLLKLLGYDPKEDKVLITSKNGAIFIKPVFEKDIEKYKNNMVRTFQKSGGSFGIYFPIELIEILEINPSVDFLCVVIDENILVIKKYLENGNI